MNRVRLSIFVALLLGMAFVPALAGDGTIKVAIANPARVFREIQETKDLNQKLENDRKAFEAQAREKQEKIKALKDERDQLKPDAPQYNERNKALLDAAVDYKVWGEIMQADNQRNQKQQMKQL